MSSEEEAFKAGASGKFNSFEDWKKRDQEKHYLQNLILEKFPNVASLKQQLSFDEACKIYSTYHPDLIIEKLEAMENKPDLKKKYSSVYLTIKGWIRLTHGKQGSNATKPFGSDKGCLAGIKNIANGILQGNTGQQSY